MEKSKKNKSNKLMLKLYLILFVAIFIVSMALLAEVQKPSGNPFITYVEKNCANKNQILNQSYIKGEKYSILKINFHNASYDCVVIGKINNSKNFGEVIKNE